MFHGKCGQFFLKTAILGYFSMVGGGDLSEYIPMLIEVSIYKALHIECQVLQILELHVNNILSSAMDNFN